MAWAINRIMDPSSPQRPNMAGRRRIVAGACLLLLVVTTGILALPATTRQGINFKVTTYEIPTYVKAIDFLHRHYQYRLLLSRICAGTISEQQCLLALMDWTHNNVRPIPAGWPIVDDHPLHIAIRGYGTDDQMADVFTTLAAYAGIPSFFRFLVDPVSGRRLVLTFARIANRWVALDVERHVVFRGRDGSLASVDDLVADASLVDTQKQGALDGDGRYSTFISRTMLLPFVVPDPLHAELQQPAPRLRYEVRRALGLTHE